MTRRWLAGLGAGASLAALPFAAEAQLVGGEVTHGSATVTQSQTTTGTHTQIHTRTRRTRMKWDRHDIPVGDSVHVQQPGRKAAYLAQVNDASVTRIDGTLSSNGQVWIANPAGVYFGGSAVVNVAKLVATAGQVSTQAFILGTQHFTNLQGRVRNDGRIVANDGVSLIGRTVANHGQIISRHGDIVMAAGDDVWVQRHDTHIEVHVPDAAGTTSTGGEGAAVENTGVLETTGRGRARLAAGDFLGLAVRNTGQIQARQIAMAAGEGSIVDVSGTLDASDTKKRRRGGRVEIEGDAIFVDDALIDVSGRRGGGEVRIGGEVAGGTGAGGEMRNARAVIVGENTEIRADATKKGDGGSIVVWSDQLTVAEGTLSARGGEEKGDGGFIETSSKGQLIADPTVDVSATRGDSGLWLLDPVDINIEDDLSPGAEVLTETATQGVTIFDFLPELDDRVLPPPPSEVTNDSIVEALVRGGSVLVTTEARFLTLTGDGVGDINVNAEIVVGANDPVRADAFSQLFLLAANDINVNADIGTANDNLTLSIDLQANNNEAVGGQLEDESQQQTGAVTINADIVTNGGSLLAEGTDVTINGGARIVASSGKVLDGSGDITNGERSANGGLVELVAFDLSDGPEQTNSVQVLGAVESEGGIVLASGDTFESSGAGSIDTQGTDVDDAEVRLGRIEMRFNETIDVQTDLSGERVDLDAGRGGDGTLTLGAVTITADEIDLAAASLVAADSAGTARIDIDPGTRFLGTGGNEDNTDAPSEFRFVQDAPIVDADLPLASQFVAPGMPDDGVRAMRYGIESLVGAPDLDADGMPDGPDLILSSPSKFAASDLSLVVPRDVELQGVFQPKNLSLTVRDGFDVSVALADAMRPTPDAGDGGLLRIQAGADGSNFDGSREIPQNLSFANGVDLVADQIVLQAGEAGALDASGTPIGTTGQVLARNVDDDPGTAEDETRVFTFSPGTAFTIIQDGSITDTNVPLASQMAGSFPILDYTLQAEGGSITLSEPDKVRQTDLTLTAFSGITLDQDISVFSADLGGFADFTVTEALLDRVVIEDARAVPTPGYDRVLKLRANAGRLAFQSTDPNDSDIPVQLRVEAERIELIGQTIDVVQGRPIFQSDTFVSPERFIFNQSTPVNDALLPTADNFPDDPAGRGPSEYFVIRSTSSITLSQEGDQSDDAPGAETGRFWAFPIHDSTRVIITGSSTFLRRSDGYNLVLGPLDELWSTTANLSAVFSGTGLRPIGFGAVDAGQTADDAFLGFDLDIDFTDTDFGTPTDDDGDAILMGSFTIDQDAAFLLRSGDEDRLPEFSTQGTQDRAFQPDTYVLITRDGTIEVENDYLANTNLQLGVASPQSGVTIDFEDGELLDVISLDVQVEGELVVDDDTRVSASDSIRFVSDTSGTALPGEGDLRFGTGIELEAKDFQLLAGGPGTSSSAVVDARTNAPQFTVLPEGGFTIEQGGVIRNGVQLSSFDPDDVDWGQIPDPAQFVDASNLALYRLVSRLVDVEINDPSEVLLGRRVQLQAGSDVSLATLTLRADPNLGPCATGAICGDASDSDLILFTPTNGVESVELGAANVSLEAPEGEVLAGDNRLLVTLFGEDPSFAIRQGDEIDASTTDASKLPDQLNIFVTVDPLGTREVPYLIQALDGVTVGSELADRVTGTDLILVGGLPQEDLDAADGSIRGQDPVPSPIVGEPPAVYDRFADSNGDGIVDSASDTAQAATVAINEPGQAFNLDLRTLLVRSEAGDNLPIQLGSVTIQTESDQIFEDEIELVGDAVDSGTGALEPTILSARAGLLDQINPLQTSQGSSIVFLEEVFSQTGVESLIVEATNRIRFAKDIGFDATNAGALQLGVLTINLQQLIQFNEAPPTPRAEFGGEDSTGEFRVAAAEVRLNPQDPEPDGSDSVFTRGEVPDAATFFRSGGDLVFDVGAFDGSPGRFEMGQNEKLSVDSDNLRILVPGGTATIGDLAALENIEVDATRIEMRRRKGGPVVRANGRGVRDSGVDYVANTIRFRDGATEFTSAALYRAQVGNGRDAKFGIADPGLAPGFMNDFSVTSIQYNLLTGDGLGPLGGPLGIDGVADGVSRRDLADTYPDIRPQVAIGVPAAYRVQQPELLKDVGIYTRLPTRDELQAAARGAATFHDLDSIQGAPGAPQLRVSEVRLVAQEVERAVRLHDQVFAPDGSRAPEVRETLQRALDDYRRSTGARRIVGFELRRYVYNRPSSQFAAYQELQKLDSLFRHHRRSGLTAAEYRRVQRAWLESIQPEGISIQELSEFVHPSRYVRGSDVLDVFGD